MELWFFGFLVSVVGWFFTDTFAALKLDTPEKAQTRRWERCFEGHGLSWGGTKYIYIYIYTHMNTYIYIYIHTHLHTHATAVAPLQEKQLRAKIRQEIEEEMAEQRKSAPPGQAFKEFWVEG